MKKHDFSNHKFRCSQLGKLMTNPKGQITEKQLQTIAEYYEKRKIKPLTLKQEETLEKLEYKRDNAEVLSETAKDYLFEEYMRTTYNKELIVESKYLDKGNYGEEDSISLVTSVRDKFYKKNEEQFENDFITGTPDILGDEEVLDIKTKWDFMGFHKEKGDSKMYYWQLQGYMFLTNREKAQLLYTLVDAPEHLIYNQYTKSRYYQGISEGSEEDVELEESTRRNMTYSDIPEEQRVKQFDFEYSEKDIELLKARILYAREYLNSIESL